jgi:hypothetical protein
LDGVVVYYDIWGQEIGFLRWAQLFEDLKYRVVEYTQLGPDVAVSTVWIGIDLGHRSGGPPLIFETMVFSEDEHDGEMTRYATYDEAVAGHRQAVEMTSAGQE